MLTGELATGRGTKCHSEFRLSKERIEFFGLLAEISRQPDSLQSKEGASLHKAWERPGLGRCAIRKDADFAVLCSSRGSAGGQEWWVSEMGLGQV